MSGVSRVNVLCPNGKRQIVHLTPNRSILKILEEVCEKQNLNPGDFDICHYNKPMDLTLPVRFANLSNNAQLELQPVKVARKECLVTVGLQLESGERIMKDFVPSTTVWNVVEQCLNTRPDKKSLDEKEEPVCIYMRQKLIGKSMKETTLHDLGLTKGSAVIRLMYRNPEDLSDQAHLSTPLSKPKEVTQSSDLSSDSIYDNKCDKTLNENIRNFSASSNKPIKFESTEASSIHAEKVQSKNLSVSTNKEIIKESFINQNSSPMDIDTSDKSKKGNETFVEQNMELDSDHMDLKTPTDVEDIGAIHYIGDRHAVLYSLDDITDVKKADLPDEFFELTIDDVKYLMEQFKSTRIALENQPLLTKELRNRQLLQQLGRFKQTVIRVYFPERLVLQAVFEAQETVQDVCNFIRNYLEDKDLIFYLYTTPPKDKKDPLKTLIESMLIPAAVVYFGCDKHCSTYLVKELKEKISDPRAASLAAYESRKDAIEETEIIASDQQIENDTYLKEIDMDSYKIPATSTIEANVDQAPRCVQTAGQVPKWFKLNAKKDYPNADCLAKDASRKHLHFNVETGEE